MSSDVALRVLGVSKLYRLFDRPEDRMKEAILPRVQRLLGRAVKTYHRTFKALDNVSFEVRRGETVGIVGRNGSGKSTLLQVVCGILQPTAGSVTVTGRIAALLELGAGFNPEFTGRENVYLHGAVLGLGREAVDQRFSRIAAFAGIGDFIERPVKTYSSGMFVRLAFAVAISLEPDILVVDEALAVGDEAFQRKCFASIASFQEKGGTILFVSHNAQTIIQLCDRALLFDAGELLIEGTPKAVVTQYQRLVNLSPPEAKPVRQEIKFLRNGATGVSSTPVGNGMARALMGHAGDEGEASPNSPGVEPRSAQEHFDPGLVSQTVVRYESQGALIRDLRLLNARGEEVNHLEMGRHYTYEYFVDFLAPATNVGFGMLINSATGLGLAGATTAYHRAYATRAVEPGSSAHVRFAFDCALLPGVYFLNAGVLGTSAGEERYLHRLLDGLAFRVSSSEPLTATGLVDLGIEPSIVIARRARATERQTKVLPRTERLALASP